MKNKKKSLVLIVLLLLVGLTSGYVTSTYAKYTKSLGNVTGTTKVAKWDFKGGTNFGTFVISLPATVNTSTLASGRIAPGTSGTFTIDLDNRGSEVGVSYEINFSGASGVPTNLVFKQDINTFAVSGFKVVGTIPAGDSDSVSLTWEWPYESTVDTLTVEDGEDTINGEAGSNVSLTATVTGVQVNPTSGATTKGYTIQTTP